MKKCTFCGHGHVHSMEVDKEKLKEAILQVIDEGVTEFYSGAKGRFDYTVLKVLSEVLKSNDKIRNTVVCHSLDPSRMAIYEEIKKEFNVELLYPFEKKVLPRFAYLKRNEWMVKNSDYLISYVNNGFGGSCKTLEYAMQKKKHN